MSDAYLFNLGSQLWGKKWRVAVLYILRAKPQRFSEIRKQLPYISVKMLSEVLHDMDEHQLITRIQYNTIPVKVTYEIHVDTKPLLKGVEVYRRHLIVLAYKNKERLRLPKHVVESIELEMSKKK